MSLDDDVQQALRSRDEALVAKTLLRIPGSVLVSLLEKNTDEQVWLVSIHKAIMTSAPFCICGQIATADDEWCEDHKGSKERYERALLAYMANPKNATARELMRATLLVGGAGVKEGLCSFPPCGASVDTDYDGGYFTWCEKHNQTFNLATKVKDNIRSLPSMRKKRGESPNHNHAYFAGEWKRESP